jgi:hypothetical protein
MMSLTSIPINFKEVFTTNVRTLHINPNWTVNQFLDTVRPILEQEFNFESGSFEIIPTGQDAPGIPAEAGLAVPISDIRIRFIWGPQLNIAFYIRRKNVVYPQLENLNRNLHLDHDINPIITHSVRTNECPICLEESEMINRYRCSHQICTDCYYRCLNTHNTTCPLCRSI